MQTHSFFCCCFYPTIFRSFICSLPFASLSFVLSVLFLQWNPILKCASTCSFGRSSNSKIDQRVARVQSVNSKINEQKKISQIYRRFHVLPFKLPCKIAEHRKNVENWWKKIATKCKWPHIRPCSNRLNLMFEIENENWVKNRRKTDGSASSNSSIWQIISKS